MFNTLKTWGELIKLGPIAKLSKEVNDFYKNTVVKMLKNEGWFDYLIEPKSVDEILSHFGYTDKEFLMEILNPLVEDGILNTIEGKYQASKEISIREIRPKLFNDGNIELSINYINAIPERLRGNYYCSTSGINLFNLDDLLTTKMYRTIRKAVFAFTDAIKKEGNFLDLGSGNGIGTAHIFSMYMQKGYFDKPNVKHKIHGVDVSADLVQIAQQEFLQKVKQETQLDEDLLRNYENHKAEFKVGSATSIPYPDNHFDVVYISQVMHWTDAKKTLQEMYRVTKPDGIVIGAQVLKPTADAYLHMMMRVIEGAEGFFTKSQFVEWAKNIGYSEISVKTPVSVFHLKKNGKNRTR
jgi:ubiquinone/menaquinone biosynthesis C-methylase UbiE